MRYQIRDWDKHFENNKSRERNACSWCPIPNKQDGLGYGRLIRQRDGIALYGAFVAVVLVCSKQKCPRHGHLTDTGRADGVPYTPECLSIKTQAPIALIDRMLKACCDVSIGWIDAYDASARVVPAECPRGALEEKRREEKEENIPLVSLADFDDFWNVYPKKVGKKAALKAWRAAKDKPILNAIINAIESQKHSEQWMKDAGQYIPNPATWINQGRWDDEAVVASKSSRKLVAASKQSAKDKLIAQYQRDILNCQTRDEAIRFIDKIHAELKDPVAEGWVMDAWIKRQPPPNV